MIVLFMSGWYYRLIEVRLLVGWLVGWLVGCEGLEYDTMGWWIWYISCGYGVWTCQPVLGLRRSLNELGNGKRVLEWIDE